MRTISRDERLLLRVTLNGKAVSGTAGPRMLLSDFLRDELGATGTHVGCEHGVCGCCTVILDGVATRSCLTLAVQADQSTIETVESLAGPDGVLNPLQAAFREHHAVQCGFCTAGILMSFTDFLRREPKPTREQVTDVLSGHLCRCTGYTDMVEAVMAVVNEPKAVGSSKGQ
jgi:2-furoyl-CoA dehydrogenase 2Fe-2S iron sulfur subunit